MPCCFLYLYDLVCSYLRCRFACVSAVFSNFRLLWILSDLQVPTGAALLRSPRLFAPSVEGGEIVLAAVRTTENACTADRRKLGCTDGRSAERQRVVEVHQIVSHPPMAASEAMPPRRALPLPRRRTPSCCKLPMEFSLGGSKGGISLFEKEISLPCPCSAGGAAIPFTASAKLPAHDSYTPAFWRPPRARRSPPAAARCLHRTGTARPFPR